MERISIISLLFMVLLFVGCNLNDKTVLMEKLTYSTYTDSIFLPDLTVYDLNSFNTMKKTSENKILCFNEQQNKIIIMDKDFNLINYIDISKHKLLSIKDVDYYNNKVFLGDNYFKIRFYDFEKNEIDSLPDLYNFDFNLEKIIKPFTDKIKVINKDLIVRTPTGLMSISFFENGGIFREYNENEKLILGTLIDYKKNNLIDLLITGKELALKSGKKIPSSDVQVSLINDTIKITLGYNKFVYNYDFKGNYLGKDEINIDKKYFIEYSEKQKSNLFKSITVIGTVINNQELCFSNDRYYRIVEREKDQTPYLGIYDNNFNELKRYELVDLKKANIENYIVIDNNFFVLTSFPGRIYKFTLLEKI